MRAEILPSYLQFLVLLLFRNSSGNAELEAVQDIEGAGSGYILYCPCMGRFGNQADHFLGVLAFAKGTARTLVIPPWIEYQIGRGGSEMVSFDSYFNASTVSEYHDAITMEYFFTELADKVWPVGRRISFCYVDRRGPESNSCNAKDGNPFGPFWSHFNVSFDASEMYGPLSYDVHHQNAGQQWSQKYPPSKFPVLAFTGAPASFPVQKDNVHLQKYLQFNQEWDSKAKDWINVHLAGGPFVGIHLRNGMDWGRACEHVNSTNQLFSSPQCLGYRNENGELSTELCMPSEKTILKQIKKAIKKVNAVSIFVASDNNHMLKTLQEKVPGVTVLKQENGSAHLDLAILTKSNFFIGNCVSSFTSFVKRYRDVEGLPSAFWGYPARRNEAKHTEL